MFISSYLVNYTEEFTYFCPPHSIHVIKFNVGELQLFPRKLHCTYIVHIMDNVTENGKFVFRFITCNDVFFVLRGSIITCQCSF